MDTADGSFTTADEVLARVALVLQDHLPTLAATAKFPAVAITSPGLADAPARHGAGWRASWRVAVAVYVRGADHNQTAALARTWAGLVRNVLLRHLTRTDDLDVLDVVWVGEEYALRPETSSARTLGGAAVAFDVTVGEAVLIPGLRIPHWRH